MYTRGSRWVVGLVAMGAVACGGDDASTSSAVAAACTPGLQSTPNTPGDPCPQNDPMCPAAPGAYIGAQAVCSVAGCEAFTTCTPQGTWNTMCQCRPKPGAVVSGQGGAGGTAPIGGMTAPPPPAGPRCGNGVVEAGEVCEMNVTITETCMSLGMGSGVLNCEPATGLYDMSMCTPAMGGSGGAGGM